MLLHLKMIDPGEKSAACTLRKFKMARNGKVYVYGDVPLTANTARSAKENACYDNKRNACLTTAISSPRWDLNAGKASMTPRQTGVMFTSGEQNTPSCRLLIIKQRTCQYIPQSTLAGHTISYYEHHRLAIVAISSPEPCVCVFPVGICLATAI
jgi:hypothetical protein